MKTIFFVFTNIIIELKKKIKHYYKVNLISHYFSSS